MYETLTDRQLASSSQMYDLDYTRVSSPMRKQSCLNGPCRGDKMQSPIWPTSLQWPGDSQVLSLLLEYLGSLLSTSIPQVRIKLKASL